MLEIESYYFSINGHFKLGEAKKAIIQGTVSESLQGRLKVSRIADNDPAQWFDFDILHLPKWLQAGSLIEAEVSYSGSTLEVYPPDFLFPYCLTFYCPFYPLGKP